MMWRERDIVIIGLMLAIFILVLQNSRTAAINGTGGNTGNIVVEGGAQEVESASNMQEQKQKNDLKDFCENECVPEGRACADSVMSECDDFNFDGCLEFRRTQCINGCGMEGDVDGSACRQEPAPAAPAKIKKSQSQIIKERNSIATDSQCAGKIIGTVQWNPHGSLCRKAEEATTSGGLLKPLDCCSKFYYGAACTQNLGMIRRGQLEYSQFFVIGCYET